MLEKIKEEEDMSESGLGTLENNRRSTGEEGIPPWSGVTIEEVARWKNQGSNEMVRIETEGQE